MKVLKGNFNVLHVLEWHVEGGVEHKCGHQSQGVSLFDLHEEQERIMLTQPRLSGTKLSIMIKLYIVWGCVVMRWRPLDCSRVRSFIWTAYLATWLDLCLRSLKYKSGFEIFEWPTELHLIRPNCSHKNNFPQQHTTSNSFMTLIFQRKTPL